MFSPIIDFLFDFIIITKLTKPTIILSLIVESYLILSHSVSFLSKSQQLSLKAFYSFPTNYLLALIYLDNFSYKVKSCFNPCIHFFHSF